jgi:hypothetical protein
MLLVYRSIYYGTRIHYYPNSPVFIKQADYTRTVPSITFALKLKKRYNRIATNETTKIGPIAEILS